MEPTPKFLYRYLGKRLDRIGDVLVHQRLYFSNPLTFGDPFDCALSLDLGNGASGPDWIEYFMHLAQWESPDSTPDERKARAEENFKRGRHNDPAFLEEVQERIKQGVMNVGSQHGVLCLSSDPGNVMLWAHYADNHEGVVLRFDASCMRDTVSQEFRCFQVTYNTSFPQLPHYLGALRASERGDQAAFPRLFFCWKSSDWRMEQEWRSFTSSPGTSVHFASPMLSGIILGWKMSQDKRALVEAWADQYHPRPDILQAEPSPHGFRMNISPALKTSRAPTTETK